MLQQVKHPSRKTQIRDVYCRKRLPYNHVDGESVEPIPISSWLTSTMRIGAQEVWQRRRPTEKKSSAEIGRRRTRMQQR